MPVSPILTCGPAGQQVVRAREVVRSLEAEREHTSYKVPPAQVHPAVRLLRTERKRLPYALRPSAYNSESAMARLLLLVCDRSADDSPAPLREAFRAASDSRRANGRPEICLNSLAAPGRTRAQPVLCQLLNDSQTSYPGTQIVHYSVQAHRGLTSTGPLCQ